MNRPHYTTLMTYLADVPDPRDERGRRYEWTYLLTIICAAMLCGHCSVRAMAQWAFLHRQELVTKLQPLRQIVPSAATLYRVLRRIDLAALEACVRAYTQAVDADDRVTGEVTGVRGVKWRGLAIDGKEVRGAAAQGAPVTLVSLVRHASGAVLAQQAVDQKTNEIKAVPHLLAGRDLRGSVSTMDALLTQTEIAQQILRQHGHYLMVVKRNQPNLYQAIADLFDYPPPPAQPNEYLATTDTDLGHGRLEIRRLESSTALNQYLDWPGVAQVLRRTRRAIRLKTGEVSEQVTYGITSLTRRQAHPVHLEQLWRGHWTIENRLHYVRDESMGEDRSTIHTQNAPQAMAALRNAILTLLRYEGWTNIPDGLRFFAASIHKSLQTLTASAS
jgi:predicted transposase YbfD/YdcC